MKILVTGAAGLIGSSVVPVLETAGHTLTLLDTRVPRYATKGSVVNGDILDRVLLADLGAYDGVIHAAAILGTSVTFGDIRKTAEVNIVGTLDLLEAFSDAKFFIQPNLLGDWLNPYMISKRAAESFGLMYGEQFEVKYISVRLTDVFGPGQSTGQGKAVPCFVTKALSNQDLPIYGTGEYQMRLLYVEDAANVLAAIAENWAYVPRTVDVTSLQAENRISVSELAGEILRLTRSSAQLRFLPMRPGQPEGATGYNANMEQARWVVEKFGLVETPHEEALRRTIDWYKGGSVRDGLY